MKLRITALICLLASATTVFAGPETAATAGNLQLLRGTYVITSARPNYQTWSVLVSCQNYQGWMNAGSDVGNKVVDGTITFDGKGGVTFSITQYGNFDQNLSNLTPTWDCDANGYPRITNSGHAVYDPPKSQSGAGTYTMQADYTGRISVGDPNDLLYFRLAGVNWIGLATAFTFHSVKSDNSSGDVGTGVMQQCGRWCMP